MENKELELQAQRLKNEADQIMKDSGIIGILLEYGEVKIGGSYALDTMVRPDLDLFIVCEKHNREIARKIFKKLFDMDYFQELDYVDGINFKTMASPGMYFQAWRNIDGTNWKLDINFMDKEEYDPEIVDNFKKLLEQHPEKRLVIMEIKQAMRHGFKYFNDIDGKKIYKAVLEEGITSVEEFKSKYLDTGGK